MLRKKIEDAIKSAGGDAARAAVAVCCLLEDEIGLADNGWFDGDPTVQAAIDNFYDEKIAALGGSNGGN